MRLAKLSLSTLVPAVLMAGTAMAADFRNREPWDYNVRSNVMALSRTSMIWQAQRAAATTVATAATDAADADTATTLATTGGIAGWFPQINSVANMNIVTVIVGDGGVADVAVQAEQQNHGAIDATAIIDSILTTSSAGGEAGPVADPSN